MDLYYFNNNPDEHGYHEVHKSSCNYLKKAHSKTYIGCFDNCKDAIAAAKQDYLSKNFDGCYWCCGDCHRG